MKIIGIAGDKYIAEVSHTELEKVMDKFYGKLEKLKAGDDLDIAEGYNFRREIEAACRSMLDAMKAFDHAKSTMTKFALMVSESDQLSSPQPSPNAAANE